MERWLGRVALVTGASAGIGAAICRRLVESGMAVVGAARNDQKIKDLAEELKDQPGSLTAMKCDLTKDEEVMALFGAIKRQFGGVDVCVNNAGMSHYHKLLDGNPEEWRQMLDVNVVALCLCTREAVASMRERNVDDGHIVHINSTSGHRIPLRSEVHFYSATKCAVTALTEGLRRELVESKSHIRVTAISPGVVKTEFFDRMTKVEGSGEQFYSQFQCLEADDVASSVVHVLSAPPHVQIHDIIMRSTEQIN